LALNSLMAGGTDFEAAESAGVSRQTVTQWRKTPVFAAELRNRQAKIWSVCEKELQGAILNAIRVLSKAIEDGDLKAACYLLDKLKGFENLSQNALDQARAYPSDGPEAEEKAIEMEEKSAQRMRELLHS